VAKAGKKVKGSQQPFPTAEKAFLAPEPENRP